MVLCVKREKRRSFFVFNKGKSEATLSESEIQVKCLPANIQKKVQRELADKTVKSESYLLKLI